MTRELRKQDIHPESKRIDTAKALEQDIDERDWDVVLCDYVMPHLSLPGVLDALHNKGLVSRSLSSRGR